MKLLFIGDVVGRSGRDKLLGELPALKAAHTPDCIIVNGENAAHGFGMTPSICKIFFAAGVDVITAGDHVWDQKELPPYLQTEKRVLRPHNFPDANPGSGTYVFETHAGKKVAVMHLLGQVFIKPDVACPFAAADALLEEYRLGANVDAIFVDFHGEATSEKCAMGHYLDGCVSAVIGTHTHIPTADGRIMDKGTYYQTDAGMCGDYNSVIGFDAKNVLKRFVTKNHKYKMEVATGEASIYPVVIEIDDKTGLAIAHG